MSKWSETHPTEPGIYWVSVQPKGRNPGPWVTLPPVFRMMITPAGDCWEIDWKKEEPTYNVTSIPSSVQKGVLYCSAQGRAPADPWADKSTPLKEKDAIIKCSCPPGTAVRAGHMLRLQGRARRILEILETGKGKLPLSILRANMPTNGFGEALAGLVDAKLIESTGEPGTDSFSYKLSLPI